jgi:hypothetical protein
MGSLAEQILPAARTQTRAASEFVMRAHLDTMLFVTLLAASVVPIWWFHYFPSQDGPAHLENTVILREYADPDRALLREFYAINTRPEPNWLGHLILGGLMTFVPILAAEKILLTGYLLLLPLSLRSAIKALRSDADFLALLVFPFVPNLFFHMGFHNFCYSLPLFFFVVGYWLKHLGAFTWRRIIGLMVLGLVLYFGHLVSLVAAWIAIGVHALWLAWLDARKVRGQGESGLLRFSRSLWPKIQPPIIAFLPSLLLALWFLSRQGWAARQSGEVLGDSTWSILVKLESLVSFSIYEGIVSVALSVFFVGLTLYVLAVRLKSLKAAPGDGLLFAALAFIALYFLTPSALAGGLFVNYRLTLYPCFALLLWFATQPIIARARWAVRAAAVVGTVALLGLHSHAYAQANDYLEEMLQVADAIEPNHTLVPLNFMQPGVSPDGKLLSVRVGPFRHAAGHIAAAVHIVNLKNYEASTGYFPMLYRSEVNPYQLMGKDDRVLDHGLDTVPPRVDFLGYAAKTGRTVDYVLIWGLRPEQRTDPATIAIFSQIEAGGYEPVAVPSRRGLVQLYRRKPS